MAETCWGKIWNASLNQTTTLTHLLVTSLRYYKLLGPTIKSILLCFLHILATIYSQSCSSVPLLLENGWNFWCVDSEDLSFGVAY
jgi:hypothetical protein